MNVRTIQRSGAALAAITVALGVALLPATASPAAAPCPAEFTATAQSDLLRLRRLDLRVLRARPLAALNLATAAGTVDSKAQQGTSVARASFADAELLVIGQLKVLAAQSDASAAGTAGPREAQLAALTVPGLLEAEAGTLTSDASWRPGYRCGQTGPLTRASINVASLTLLPGSSGRVSAAAADGSAASTSLLRIGSAGAAQTFTELVRLADGRVGVAAGAGGSLASVSLFEGTGAEVAVKVVSQPKLMVVAAGRKAGSLVEHQPAVLQVTAGGRPVASLSAENTTADVFVDASLRGGTARPSLLSVQVSIGEVSRNVTDSAVAAEAATLRLKVSLGRVVLLDAALGHLQVKATSAKPWAATAPAAARGDTGAAGRPNATVVTGRQAEVVAATPAGAAPELNAVALTEPQPGFAERDRTIGPAVVAALALAVGAGLLIRGRRRLRGATD
ncbi:hypothetical protein GCM10009662_76980 [Catellatospora coxensis]|uniref:hypothetical protein n=1 Tax=Catellatospora coxensis TaxID=310354 RepID=UPI0031DA4C59